MSPANDDDLSTAAADYAAKAVGYAVLRDLAETEFRDSLQALCERHGGDWFAEVLGGAAIDNVRFILGPAA